MAKVIVNLDAGFFKDRIVILINGRPELKLDTFTSYPSAECVLTVDVPVGRVSIEVVLPKRNISRRVERRSREVTSCTVSMCCDTLQFTIGESPTGGTSPSLKPAA